MSSPRPHGPFVVPEIRLAGLAALPPALHDPAAQLIAEAELVVGHRVDYLGSGETHLGPHIDWHRDFKSGYRWEPVFYQDVAVTRLDDGSDAKVPWELSRGHQLLTLARAACLTGDERYVRELENQLGSWLEANPPGHGINWVTSMELGLRVVNWLWALGTIEGTFSISATLRAAVAGSIYGHARHIEHALEGTPYLRSNHYLGDILGLIAAGAAFPEDARARRWLRRARRAFERQILKQTYPDGVGFEGSLAYHGLSLEMFLVAFRLAAWARSPMSARYQRRLRSMVEVVRAARHPDGRIPLFGDQDSGRVLPAGFSRPATHDHLVWLAAAVLGEGAVPLSGPPSPEVAWNLGLDAYERLARLTQPQPAPATAFPSGGLYVLDGGGTHVVARCGDVGQSGAGGHAHNDLFSYELSRGAPLVVDSGTYAYTFDVTARNEMRASAAHNVTIVDGEEINPFDPAQIFRLPQVATPVVQRWIDGPDRVELVVSHDGYAREPLKLAVRRTFRLDRITGELEIEDEVDGAGDRTHTLETFVHLPAGARIERVDESTVLVAHGGAGASISFKPGVEVEVKTGWVSSEYGRRAAAPVLTGRLRTTVPASIGYRVIAPPGETGRRAAERLPAATAPDA